MAHTGRVIQSTGSWYKISYTGDEIVLARLPGKFRLDKREQTNPLAVGDVVDFEINDDETATITSIHERVNKIVRKATHGRKGEHIIAANIDRGFVIQSVKNPGIKTGFIDRFLVTCEAYEVEPIIIIIKMDLASEKDIGQVDELIQMYSNLHYIIQTCSIFDEKSIKRISEELKDHTSVFIGPSGVGKTSILNAIAPELNRATSEISGYSGKGIHTTTFAELIPLPFGGFLVDTPGIREFGMVDIEPYELSLFYPEMIEYREQCRYYNCTHDHEPDCAVKEAYKAGKIEQSRYKSYILILHSLAE